MHAEPLPVGSGALDRPITASDPWYRGLTRYHWFVFVVASLGWLFDTMDQQLFNLARKPAVTELIGAKAGDPAMAAQVSASAANSTSVFIIGWAIGGLVFGVLGDRIGRAKTMILTILLYSAFTGLSAFSWDIYSFSFFRFLTGLGVGGEFAVGVALVAEVMPDRARPFALGWLQALSAIGNMTAALCTIALGVLARYDMLRGYTAWRLTFLIGVVPAFLALGVFRKLKEPERWQKAAAQGDGDQALIPRQLKETERWQKAAAQGDGGQALIPQKLGSLTELFGDPRWRHNTIVGMLLAFSGVVGLWGIGFFSPDLTRSVFQETFQKQGLAQSDINFRLDIWVGIAFLLQNFGAFWGIYAFSRVTHHIGRRPAFAISFLLAMGSTALTFWFLDDFYDVFWMLPLMGFCQMTLFGGYAIYLPELFPTRLRSSGTSFCYNVGRLVAATGPLTLGYLTSKVFAGYPQPLPMRYAGVSMCGVFLLGLLALPFAPETRGQPLPE